MLVILSSFRPVFLSPLFNTWWPAMPRLRALHEHEAHRPSCVGVFIPASTRMARSHVYAHVRVKDRVTTRRQPRSKCIQWVDSRLLTHDAITCTSRFNDDVGETDEWNHVFPLRHRSCSVRLFYVRGLSLSLSLSLSLFLSQLGWMWYKWTFCRRPVSRRNSLLQLDEFSSVSWGGERIRWYSVYLPRDLFETSAGNFSFQSSLKRIFIFAREFFCFSFFKNL